MPYLILLLEAFVVPCQLIQDFPLCGKLPPAAKHKIQHHDLKLEPRHIHLRMNVFRLHPDVLNSHIQMFLSHCFLAVCGKTILHKALHRTQLQVDINFEWLFLLAACENSTAQ